MTLPMTTKGKRELSEALLKKSSIIVMKSQFMMDCLKLNKKDEFDGNLVIMAKNMALDICNKTQVMEHHLHELMDAPLIPDDDEPVESG